MLIFAVMMCGITCAAEESYNWYIKKCGNSTPGFPDNASVVTQNGGIYLDIDAAEKCEKTIYLTFDAGYENGNVAKILDVLKEQEVPGAFFILGNLIKRNPDLVCRMADEGHLVCNHTYTHKNITKLSEQELTKELVSLENEYLQLTGKHMSKYFRPPEGTFDKKSLQQLYNAGYKTVFWSFAYADWDNNKQMSAQAAKEKIMDNLHNGEIMLLHPTSATNAEILHDVICELKQMGYRFATLDALFTD